MPGTLRDEERLAELEEVLDRLRQAAAGNLVLVEGRKDVRALRELGVGGTHVVLNQGRSLEAVGDRLAEEAAETHRTVLILTDWDRTGGRLFARFFQALAARVSLDIDLRRRLAQVCHAKALEEVPAELAALRRSAGHPL